MQRSVSVFAIYSFLLMLPISAYGTGCANLFKPEVLTVPIKVGKSNLVPSDNRRKKATRYVELQEWDDVVMDADTIVDGIMGPCILVILYNRKKRNGYALHTAAAFATPRVFLREASNALRSLGAPVEEFEAYVVGGAQVYVLGGAPTQSGREDRRQVMAELRELGIRTVHLRWSEHGETADVLFDTNRGSIELKVSQD